MVAFLKCMNNFITNLTNLPVGVASSFKKIFDDLNTNGYLEEIVIVFGFGIALCILAVLVSVIIKKRGF